VNVLSFTSWHGVHDTAAALVCDGRVVAAAEEERFSRRVHESRVPLAAIGFCLRHAGLQMHDVDAIAFAEQPYRTGPDSKLAAIDRSVLWRLYRAGHVRGRGLVHHALLDGARRLHVNVPSWSMDPIVAAAFAEVRERYGELPPVRFYDHHEAHAAAAYLTSDHDEAAIATIDGRGDPNATVTWHAQGDALTRLRSEPWTNSLGFFFRDCTHYLGLGKFGEGKAMGLAAYGDPQTLTRHVDALLDTRSSDRWYVYRRRPAPALLGFGPSTGKPPLDGQYAPFAAAAQQALERGVQRVVRSALGETGAPALCLAGGVALNCSANGRLLTMNGAPPPTVFAAAGDAGLPVGAALLAARDLGEPRRGALEHAYLGPAAGDGEIERALRAQPRVSFHRSADVVGETAELLATAAVVGWFQGRMELGPRALGNRSILALPGSTAIRDRVNRCKGRESWRPLAPSVIAERAADFFELPCDSPFMLFAARVKPAERERLAGVVHVDGSARPQTVRPRHNPRFHALLSRVGRLTGTPVLLNTSFNAAGEPIVCDPAQAIATFLATGLDALVIGDYVARHAR
jgi:carbamoyltransferase